MNSHPPEPAQAATRSTRTRQYGQRAEGSAACPKPYGRAEKSGFQPAEAAGIDSLREFTERMTREAMESMQQAATQAKAETPPPEQAKR